MRKKIAAIVMITTSFSCFGLSCPSGYISVPSLAPYTSSEFCVMKYEAKDESDKPVSKSSGIPWIFIGRDTAILKCRSLGTGYDLISNDQWQTIARNIASVASNWSGGKVASGELNRGLSDDRSTPIVSTVDTNIGVKNGTLKNESRWNARPASEVDRKEAWSSQRRTHDLSNGNIIWDFAGNVSEYVSSETLALKDPEAWKIHIREKDYVSFANTGDAIQINYGASSNTICSNSKKPPYCGMGYLHFPAYRDKTPAETAAEFCAANYRKNVYYCGKDNSNFPPVQSWKAIHRGGANGYGVLTGIFSVNFYGPLSNLIGFRCVYAP